MATRFFKNFLKGGREEELGFYDALLQETQMPPHLAVAFVQDSAGTYLIQTKLADLALRYLSEPNTTIEQLMGREPLEILDVREYPEAGGMRLEAALQNIDQFFIATHVKSPLFQYIQQVIDVTLGADRFDPKKLDKHLTIQSLDPRLISFVVTSEAQSLVVVEDDDAGADAWVSVPLAMYLCWKAK